MTLTFDLDLIGMEASSYMAGKAESITCLDILDIPFKLVLGDTVGLALKKVRNIIKPFNSHLHH